MIVMSILAVRVAIAASFLTLAVAAIETAQDLTGPYALLVFLVALTDLLRWRRRAAR